MGVNLVEVEASRESQRIGKMVGAELLPMLTREMRMEVLETKQ